MRGLGRERPQGRFHGGSLLRFGPLDRFNHPFVDGTERAGLAAAIAFLGLNDLWLEANEEELAELLAVAEGRIGKPEIAVFVRGQAVSSRAGAAGVNRSVSATEETPQP